VVVREVSEQGHEHFDVSHLVQEVLISQLFRRNITHRLNVSASALAVSANNRVLHHLALLALEILHLVGDQSSVGHVKESLFNTELVHHVTTGWVLTCPVTSHNIVLIHLICICRIDCVLVVDVVGSANVDV
jgi:hypothetical protein